MRVIGIDLSGPSNHKDTVVSVFEKQGPHLTFIKMIKNVSDIEILKEIREQAELDEVVIGIDAPLSYQDGGGDREGDRLLRQFIVKLGMKSGSIMPPTFNRMVYLTLRGIKLSMEIEKLIPTHPISIVEVHPGAVIGSRMLQEELDYVLHYKKDVSYRQTIRKWFATQNLIGLPITIEEESHCIDACAAALGAWCWKDPDLKPKWQYSSESPFHPYDFCC